MKTETRDYKSSIELRALHSDQEDKPKRIAGLGMPTFREGDSGTEFALWDGAIERIMPGAFDATLARDDITSAFNHNFDNLLGRTSSGTLTLSVDERGLNFEIEPSGTTIFRDVSEMISRGDVGGASVQFIAEREEWRTDGDIQIREISELRLFEVGPVVNPAYEATSADIREARSRFDALPRKKSYEVERARMWLDCLDINVKIG